MHTHFGSATHLAAVFSGVLLAGTLWKLGWLHALNIGAKKGWKPLQSLAQAALFQYGG